MNIFRSIRRLFPEKKVLPGHYNIKVVSLPAEIHQIKMLPKELVYVFARDKSFKVRISKQLEHSGLGLRTIDKTPSIILEAVNDLSVITQHRTIIPWLRPLLKDGKKPVFTHEDYENASKKNINLDKLVNIIYSRRFDFKQFIIIDEKSRLHPEENIQMDHELDDATIEYSIRSLDIQKCPKELLGIIKDLSILYSSGSDIKWLTLYLKDHILPSFSSIDYTQAHNQEIDLNELFEFIKEQEDDLVKFLLENVNLKVKDNQDLELINDLNQIIEEIAIEYAIQRITFDNADTRTAVAQSIIKALLILGPITHFLEKYVQGVGKVFAATTDDILSETAELFALRGSGFSWKVLFNRSKILLPIFIIATYGAFKVENFISLNMYIIAGLIFGFSAVALSFTTAILSIRLYKHCVDDLIKEGKITLSKSSHKWTLALKQDFTNPARLGLFLGAFCSPLVASFVFTLFPFLVHNGWILAILGSTETIVAGTTVLVARRLNDLKYRRIIKRYISDLSHKK